MNASNYMDKQIMDLSRSKSNSLNNNNINSNDFLDLMNPQSEEESDNNGGSSLKNKDEILPNYDFQPILRSTIAVQSLSSDPPPPPSAAIRAWNSVESKSYSSLDHGDRVEPDKIILEKTQKANDSAIISEIDQTMKRHTDSVLHAIDGLSARLSQLENRTRHLEHSVDELKLSIGNNHGSTDGKMRQLENILLEVQNGVQDLKDKQEVMEGHMQLKLQSSELSNALNPDSVQQTAASAPPQQSGLQQFSIAAPQQVSPLPPNVPPSSQQNIHPSPVTTQFHPGHTPPGPQQDAYFPSPNQPQEARNMQYQMPPGQHQQQPPTLAPPPQQYQSSLTPPYPPPSQPPQQQPYPPPSQPPQQQPYPPPSQPPQQQHPAVVGANAPQFPPPLGHRPEEGPYISSQNYPQNLHQPVPHPSTVPPHSQPYYGSASSMYEPPPTGRSSSGFPSTYVPPSGPGEQYPYGAPTSHFGSGSSNKAQPHSPVGSSSNYPQLPTAKILPAAIPTAAGISGGSSSGGSGNKVPIDDVIDKVTNMGFPKDHVRATVRKLTENGQSVDLNIVLDKLMNDGDIQPPRGGWFGR